MASNTPLAATPPPSTVDFATRLSFFLVAPYIIALTTQLFPVSGVLIDAGSALVIFLAGEGVYRWLFHYRLTRWLLSTAFDFEKYYSQHPPRPFIYYIFYPLLFPYWLVVRDARREFFIFRSYTVASLLILLGNLGWQYYFYWYPELGLRIFAPYVAVTFVAETILVLALLMPIATTVVRYHAKGQRSRLVVLLSCGLLSVVCAIGASAHHRDPIVSFSTRERVLERTAVNHNQARRVMLMAIQSAWGTVDKNPGIEGDGKVTGAALEKAQATLQRFYKQDEAQAFDLWASPRKRPQVLVLYFEAYRKHPPLWVGIQRDGHLVHKASQLPHGAFKAMHQAADGNDALEEVMPEELLQPPILSHGGKTR